MKLRRTIYLSAFAVLAASFSTNVAHAQSATLGVEFGQKLSGGGDCVGNGVCECSPQNTTGSAAGINVLFSTNANQSTLILTFSLTDLKNSQPDQVQAFENGSYIFDNSYSLSDPMFGSLNLPVNAMITPNSNSTVVINGDVVTDYIALSYGVN